MPRSDQGIIRDRYTVIPRTAIFLRRWESYLLLKSTATKRLAPIKIIVLQNLFMRFFVAG